MNRNRLGLLLLWTLLLPAVAAAQLPTRVLGSGAVYTVRAGTYGELFPGGREAVANSSVVALDVVRSGAAGNVSERLAVPATLGAAVETAPGLVLDPASGRLNVLWQSQTGGRQHLFLAGLDDAAFGEAHEIFSGPPGSDPEVGVTHDVFALALPNGSVVRTHREVIHVVWLEELGGETLVRYAPHVLIEGLYAGISEVFTLGRLEGEGEIQTALGDTLQLKIDDGQGSVIVTFGSAASGHLDSYQIGIVPLELVYLSDEIRDAILGAVFARDDLPAYGDVIGAQIIGIGRKARFNPALIDYLAGVLVARILETGATYGANEVDRLADDLWQVTLETLCQLFAVALGETTDGMQAIQVKLRDESRSREDDGPSSHILDIRRVAERPFPVVEGTENALFQSSGGQEMVVVWRHAAAPTTLWYIEWREGAWTPARPLHLGEDLALADALKLLRERLF